MRLYIFSHDNYEWRIKTLSVTFRSVHSVVINYVTIALLDFSNTAEIRLDVSFRFLTLKTSSN